MAKKKKLHIAFLLDETGSMQSVKDQTISGFNEYLGTLKKDNPDAVFTLTRFNSGKIDIVSHEIGKIAELNHESYLPENLTPLYDAIGHTIQTIEGDVGKKDRVLFTIMTDGYENDSHQYNQRAIFDLIKKKEEGNWSFVFLGADQDAWEAGQQIGLKRGNVLSYSSTDTAKTLGEVATASARFAASNHDKTDEFFSGS